MRGLPLRFLFLVLLVIGSPAQAQVPQRAEGLIAFWNGETEAKTLFSAAFLQAVPAEQVKGIAGQIRAELGRAVRVGTIKPDGPASAVTFEFERGELDVRLAVAAEPPHLIQGLLVTASRRKDDSFARVAEDLRALPGSVSFAVARLGDAAPAMLAGADAERPRAVGSVFKLFILAELDRQVRAGERRWSDVAPLSRKSLPSGMLQDWPAGAPLTLHSLAALMISQSDNSASDTLLHLLGREKVEALLPALGLRNPAANRPFLSTLEAFALKGDDDVLTRRWLATDEAGRRKLLADVSAVPMERIDIAKLQAKPNHIDRVEWFASAEDLVRTLDWLRRNADKEALDILTINPGLPRTAAQPFAYWGYKGGSETGVVAMSFLVRDKAGAWHAVAGSWNDQSRPVDEQKFALLIGRALGLLSR
jgi:beta-lactamase class A